MVLSTCQACQAPSDDEHDDAERKDFRTRTEGPRRHDVDEQFEHAEELQETARVEDGLLHQILSKFFSISRRVSRSITGRPCGHTVEYAVARNSSRMCAIFSNVSGSLALTAA